MKITSRRSLIVISWLVALGIGMMIGRESRTKTASSGKVHGSPHDSELSSSPAPSTSEVRQTSRSTVRKSIASQFTGTAEERQTQAMTELSDILNTSNRVERTRQMLSFIDQIGDEEMAGIITGFQEAD